MKSTPRLVLAFALVCAVFTGACGSDSDGQADASACDMDVCMACLDEVAAGADAPPKGQPICETECGKCTEEAEADEKHCADGTSPSCADED